MSYVLGVDLGTTYSSAAIHENGRAEIVQLGTRQATIPSVVLLRQDGEVLVGEAAERRAAAEPDRVAREFKRRLGDSVPLILGGTPYGAEALIAHLLRWIIGSVAQEKGEAPQVIAITHPASYGPYKLDLLQQAARQADVQPVIYLTEPQAAAVHYAEQERIPPEATVAVYDFGGGTFDAAVVRRRDEGWELLGPGEGLERLGGMDFDEAVFAHVRTSLEGKIEELSPDLPAAVTAMSRLRVECTQAKESLSEDTESTISVLLPNVQTDVRLTRSEFENLIRPRVRETVTALERAVRSSGLSMDQIDRILLVGGSSRIPLVAEIVGEATGRPLAIDAQPKHTIALGAAIMAAREELSERPTASLPQVATSPDREIEPPVGLGETSTPPDARPVNYGETSAPLPEHHRTSTTRGRNPPLPVLGAGLLVLIAILAGAVLVLGGGNDDTSNGALPTATTDSAALANTEQPTLATETQVPVVVPTHVNVTESAAITGITVVGGYYYVDFTASGFEPNIEDVHVHFFFDTVPPEQAGVPGSGPWVIYDTPSPFTEYAVSDRPSGAEQICILVANPDHSVRQGTGNCWPLP